MTGTLLLALGEHLALTALPGVAATLLAARQGVRTVPILLAIGLAASGSVALLAFWAFYVDPVVGEAFGFFVLFGSLVSSAECLRGGRLPRDLLRQLAVPIALWALASAFLVFLGFAHGGAEFPVGMASTRFSTPLPSDNDIPRFFSDWFFANGGSGTPPVFPGEWLSSDRPPLQVGYALWQRPFGWDGNDVHYQVLGVVLQQLWVVGLWAVLLAAGLGRRSRALALIAVLLSHVAIVNGFFVWPKLLPAAFVLAVAAIVLTPLWERLRRDPRAGALIAVLCGLAFLGHGSSVFAIIPLAIVAVARGLPSGRWVGAALLAAALLVVPWTAYQRYDDPPGDRLTKWSLAGVVEIDERSTGEVLVERYREEGFVGTLHNKGQNFVTIAGGGPAWEYAKSTVRALGDGDTEHALALVRQASFFYLLPSLGLLLLGPLAMLVAWRRADRGSAEWRFAISCFVLAAIGCFFWSLLMFGNAPARTSIHVGSLAIPILAICGCVAGLRATFPRLALYYVPAVALFTLALYVPALEPLPGSAYSAPAFLLAGASLAGFGAVLLGGGFRRGE